MSKIKNPVIIIVVLIALSITSYSITKSSEVSLTDDIGLEEVKDCKTTYWQEEEPVHGICTDTHTETVCDDEPLNTSCYIQKNSYNYSCITEYQTVQKSREICKDKEILLTVDALITKNYKLEYGEWGKCSYEAEGEAVVILCDSRLDGNNDGICQPGESCIKFIVTKDGVQRLFRNSRNDFVEDDETFRQEKLNFEVI